MSITEVPHLQDNTAQEKTRDTQQEPLWVPAPARAAFLVYLAGRGQKAQKTVWRGLP